MLITMLCSPQDSDSDTNMIIFSVSAFDLTCEIGNDSVYPIYLSSQSPCMLQKAITGRRGVYLYIYKLNPLLFAGFSLPRTKIRPKHSEGEFKHKTPI